jgi:hypothetical protein
MISRRNSGFFPLVSTGSIILALCGLYPANARAADDDASATETATARALAVEGLKLAKGGQCEEAVDKLDRAEKLKHSAIVLSHLGECYISLGKLVQGTEALRKVLREPMPPDPSPALKEAYERAQTLVQETKPKIAGLTIKVTGAKDVKFTITLDGVELPSTVVGVELPSDPGEHAIEASAPGYLKVKARTKLASGEKGQVALELKRDPNAVPAEKTAAAAAVQPPPPQQGPVAESAPAAATSEPVQAKSSSGKTWAYLSYGLGAVGLGAGIIFGRSAMQDKDILASNCPQNVCPPEEQDRLDSAKTKGLVSTIGFAVGGAGLTLGTVLLLTSGSSSSSGAATPPKRRTVASGLKPRAAIGLGRVVVGADF